MIQIQLNDKLAAALRDQARLRGQSLEEFLKEVAARQQSPDLISLSGEEVVKLIEQESSAHDSQYVGTYSREDIYSDHD